MSKLLKITFPSDTGYLRCVEVFFHNFMNINEINKLTDKNEIFLALVEGIVNAIKHGNKCKSDKNVTVELSYEAKMLKIIVNDMGEGFDPNVLKDPTHPENLSVPGGRGIFLIKKLMDRTDYLFSEEGTQLIMEKYV